jgi:hypothetical protein
MSNATWQVRFERQQRRREQQRKESAMRAEIRPLRNAVNKALKDAGIPHSKTHYSSRVKGWPISTSEGWETDSIYWSEPKYIRVEVTARVGGAGSRYDNARELELREMTEKALSSFDYKEEHGRYEVFGVKPALAPGDPGASR